MHTPFFLFCVPILLPVSRTTEADSKQISTEAPTFQGSCPAVTRSNDKAKGFVTPVEVFHLCLVNTGRAGWEVGLGAEFFSQFGLCEGIA